MHHIMLLTAQTGVLLQAKGVIAELPVILIMKKKCLPIDAKKKKNAVQIPASASAKAADAALLKIMYNLITGNAKLAIVLLKKKIWLPTWLICKEQKAK